MACIRKMNIPKSTLYTIYYIIFTTSIALWVFLIPFEKYPSLIKNGHFFNSLLTIICVSFFLKNKEGTDFLIIKRTKLKFYLIAIGFGILFPLIHAVLRFIYYQENLNSILTYEFDISRINSLAIIASILIVPIIEEFFFRKFIQGNLIQNYNAFVSILITSLLFAFIHFPFLSFFSKYIEFSMYQAFSTFFGGIIMGLLFYKSKSVGPSIVLHMIWNMMAYSIIK